jgi:hypothetical protein
MWMEENIGERINSNRTKEAIATGADQIAVGCPFCRVMLSDGLTAEQASGGAREDVEVLDVAQMLLASVRGETAPRRADAAAPDVVGSEETKSEPQPGDETQTSATITETADVGPAAKASGGSSLFDVEPTEAPAAAPPSVEESESEPAASGGSLFDVEPTTAPEAAPPTVSDSEPEREPKPEPTGGSLFDIAPTAEPEPPAPDADDAPQSARPGSDAGSDAEPDAQPEESDEEDPSAGTDTGSLFDL